MRLIVVLFLILIGCRQKSDLQWSDASLGTGPGNQSVDLTPQMEVFKNSVYQITSKNCVQCHGSVQKPFHGSPNISVAYEAAKTKVNFSNAAGSTIVLKSTDGHCGLPLICKTDGSAMLAAVMAWAKAEAAPPPPPPKNGVLMETAASRLRLGNRHFIATKLDFIFGPSQAVTINNIVRYQPIYFGGPCDRHNGDFVGDGNDEIMGDCEERASSQSAIVPFPSSGRFAYMMRACDLAAQSDAAVVYAVNRAVGSNATTRAVASTDIESLHKMFYFKKPSTAVNTALANLASTAQTQAGFLESWRFVLFTLCSDPGWQIP